jgi:hypothetical protein
VATGIYGADVIIHTVGPSIVTANARYQVWIGGVAIMIVVQWVKRSMGGVRRLRAAVLSTLQPIRISGIIKQIGNAALVCRVVRGVDTSSGAFTTVIGAAIGIVANQRRSGIARVVVVIRGIAEFHSVAIVAIVAFHQRTRAALFGNGIASFVNGAGTTIGTIRIGSAIDAGAAAGTTRDCCQCLRTGIGRVIVVTAIGNGIERGTEFKWRMYVFIFRGHIPVLASTATGTDLESVTIRRATDTFVNHAHTASAIIVAIAFTKASTRRPFRRACPARIAHAEIAVAVLCAGNAVPVRVLPPTKLNGAGFVATFRSRQSFPAG